jgi:hypothetical protein
MLKYLPLFTYFTEKNILGIFYEIPLLSLIFKLTSLRFPYELCHFDSSNFRKT